MRLLAPLATAAAALAGCAAVAQPATHEALLKNGAGKPVGSVALMAAPNGVLMKLDLTGLPPGWHAIHVHEKGDCSDATFKAAGAHTHAATPAVHGLLNAQATDTGDLPNIYVAADGTAKAELLTTMVSLSGSDRQANLLDTDGSALVVHAKPDDHMSQPIGGAGERIACGIVR